jgi:hypothetical protein
VLQRELKGGGGDNDMHKAKEMNAYRGDHVPQSAHFIFKTKKPIQIKFGIRCPR